MLRFRLSFSFKKGNPRKVKGGEVVVSDSVWTSSAIGVPIDSVRPTVPHLLEVLLLVVVASDTLDVFHKFLAGVSPFKPCTV